MKKPTKAAIAKSFANLEGLRDEAIQSALTMRDSVQNLLVGCVSHYKMTGNNDGLKELVNAFVTDDGVKGINTPAIVEWCNTHLGMFTGEDKEGNACLFFRADFEPKMLNVSKSTDSKWWTLKKVTPFAFDQVNAILALAKKSASAAKKSDAEGVILDALLSQKLAELATLAKKVDSAMKAAAAAEKAAA